MKLCTQCSCPIMHLQYDKRRVLCIRCSEVPAPVPAPVQKKRKPGKLLIEDMALVKAARRALTERQKKWQRT